MLALRRLVRVLVAVVVTALAATGVATVAAEPAPVVVGVLMPLTGNLAAFGVTSEQGVEIAADDINRAGGIASLGGAKIKLVIRDSTSDAAGAAEACARLIDDVHPLAIIGSYASALTLTASSVAERRGIPFLTMSFADEITGRGYKNVFQLMPKASVVGMAAVEYAAQIAAKAGRPLKSIAVVYENGPLGSGYAVGFKAAADKLHLAEPLAEAYPHGLTDAGPLVQKIVQSGADVVLPASYYTDAVLIVRGLKQSNANVQIVGGAGGWLTPALYDALGPLTENIMSVDTSNYDLYGLFEQHYVQRFKTFAPHEAYENGMALYVIANALEKSKATTPDALRDALAKTDVHGGVFLGIPGNGVKFDANGLNTLAVPEMVQWRRGGLVTVWPAVAGKTATPVWLGKPVK